MPAPLHATSKTARLESRARAAFQSEEYLQAARLYEKALEAAKDDPDLLRRLGLALILAGKPDDALVPLRKSVKRRPLHADTLLILAFAHQRLERDEEMFETLDRALRAHPWHGPCVHAKARGLIDAGRPEEAYAFTAEAMKQPNPHHTVVTIHARACRVLKQHAEGIDTIRPLTEDPQTPPGRLASALFELGALLDESGDHAEAFNAFSRANAFLPAAQPMHAESVTSTWTKEFFDALPESDNDSEQPLLIIGVARSGTTLTEQIIAAHPKAVGVGEVPLFPQIALRTLASNLDQPTIKSYANEYLAEVRTRAGATGKKAQPGRIIDKHIGSEKSLGLFARMFPNARFIHCLRDPIDCCLSAYFQNFGPNVPVSRDLVTLGKNYVAHRKLMDHWAQILDHPIHTSVYEDLVEDPESASRALIAHTGLDWNDACLRHHEAVGTVRTASTTQVRAPIYKSSAQRWKPYAKHLGPLIDALGPYADHARDTLNT